MTAWEEYKKKRAQDLQGGAQVRPTDLLNRNNHTGDDVADARMAICYECPSLIQITNQCRECGCFMKLKTKLAAAVCPIGKW